MKKLTAFTLCLVLLVSIITLSGCGSNSGGKDVTETTGTSVTESVASTTEGPPPVLRFITRMNNESTATKDLFVFKEWSDAVGAVIEPIVIPSDVYKTKIAGYLASGDMPDLINTNDLSLINSYGPKGMFLKLNEYWDKLPNYKAYIQTYSEEAKSYVASDGNLYVMPVFDEAPKIATGIQIRTDLLAKAGIDSNTIETMDDLTNAMTALKELNGGKAPLGARWKYSAWMMNITPIFGTSNDLYFDDKTGAYTYGPLSSRYKELISYLAKWYKSGLLHKNFMNMEDKDLELLYRSGEISVLFDNLAWDVSKDIQGATEFVVKPPKLEGERIPIKISGSISGANPWAISAGSKYIDKTLAMADYLYSDEGKELILIGREGVTWAKDTSSKWGGTMLCKVFNYNADNENAKSYVDYGIFNGKIQRVFPKEYGISLDLIASGGRMSEWMKYLEDNGCVGTPAPNVSFTPEEQEEVNALKTQLTTFVDENTIKFVIGSANMSEWNGFTDKLKNLKADRLVELYNTAYKRLMDAKVPLN